MATSRRKNTEIGGGISPEESAPLRPASGPYTVRALERALGLLKFFDVDRPGWTLAELSRASGLHKATCFRLVKTLEAEGFLTLDSERGHYLLGPALVRIAFLARSHDELIRTAHPYMERLAACTGETADLAVWSPDGVLFLDQVVTAHPFKPPSRAGRVFNDFGNSHSKILAAFGPQTRRAKLSVSQKEGLTLADTAALLAELDEVARSGVAYDLEEQRKGICAVAAPVRDAAREVVASMAVVVPVERFGLEARAKHTAAVKQVATDLSGALGYRSSS
jgi:DNA-binding IclR family transcriptional regulator